MGYVLSAQMGKKNEFIRIRADDMLKDALANPQPTAARPGPKKKR